MAWQVAGRRVPDAGACALFSVQVMAMEAVSDKESDGSPEEDDEGKEKSQEKKKKSSKVCIPFCHSCFVFFFTILSL